jgi:hypothetical protein
MRRVWMAGFVAIVIASAAALAAQTKSLTRETETVTATVEAITPSSRTVTVKKPDGTFEEFYVPEDVKRFDQLKVGDKITARYYENVVLRVQAPGEAAVDDSKTAVTPTVGALGATAAHQRTITATITAIDLKVPSITFTGPHDWKYSTRVEDKQALSKVKVGDKVQITWTEAAVVSIEPAK